MLCFFMIESLGNTVKKEWLSMTHCHTVHLTKHRFQKENETRMRNTWHYQYFNILFKSITPQVAELLSSLKDNYFLGDLNPKLIKDGPRRFNQLVDS